MDRIKNCVLFRVISFVLIASFIALDISYAYPPEHNAGNSTLATPSLLQQQPINENIARFQQSVFSQSALIASVYDIGEYFFGNADRRIDPLPSKHAAEVMRADLGKHLSAVNTEILGIVPIEDIKTRTAPGKLRSALDEIGFKGTLPDEGVVFILYKKGNERFLVQIARKGEVSPANLPGYEWVVSDKYVVKYIPEDYKEEKLQSSSSSVIASPAEQNEAISSSVAKYAMDTHDIKPSLQDTTKNGSEISPQNKAPAGVPKTSYRIAKLLIVPVIVITLSYISGDYYASLFVSKSFSWKQTIAATIIGGITLGAGNYMAQTARGELVNWTKTWKWASVGAILIGPLTYGIWFPYLWRLTKGMDILFPLIDLCLYAPLVFIPLEFLAQKYFVSRGEPTPGFWRTVKSNVRISGLNLIWFFPIQLLGLTVKSDCIVLFDANAGIIWAGFLVYFLDRWKISAGRGKVEIEKKIRQIEPMRDDVVAEISKEIQAKETEGSANPELLDMAKDKSKGDGIREQKEEDDSARPETEQISKATQLFEIVESAIIGIRVEFINAGNKLINSLPSKSDPEIAANIGFLDNSMATAEIRQRVEKVIEAIGSSNKEGVTSEAKVAVELLKANFAQFEADGAAGALIVLARKAKKENQKLIIGLETDWIPGMKARGSLQRKAMAALMKEIWSIGKAIQSMGLDNVEIIRGSGDQLADSILKAANKDGHTDMRNIVVMASRDTIEKSDGFKVFRDASEEDRPFLTGIDPIELTKLYEQYGESVSKQLHIKLAALLYMTLEAAAGKEPPQAPWIHYDKVMRILILVPSAEPIDYKMLEERYKVEKTALAAA